MSDGLLFSSFLAITASLVLLRCSHFAGTNGLPQGAFFASGKGAMVGAHGLLLSMIITWSKSELVDVVVMALLSFFLCVPFLLAKLREGSQIAGLVGMPVGLLFSLFY